MGRTGRPRDTVSIPKNVFSVKIASVFLAGLLIVGAVPVTHSYPTAKADLSNIWLAVIEFWDSLAFFKSQQLEQQAAALDSANPEPVSEVPNQGLENLKNHPECRSIYVAEYLPTFNSSVIEKCEKAIKRHEQKQLFGLYVKQLCANAGDSPLDRQQLGQVQLRLRKYSLTFPQSDINIAELQIDGLYGVKTCEAVANYQIISRFSAVNGIADEQLYNDLAAAIPLSQSELASLTWQKKTKPALIAKKDESQNEPPVVEKPSFKLPLNPFKRILFCIKHNHIKQCQNSARAIDVALADLSNK